MKFKYLLYSFIFIAPISVCTIVLGSLNNFLLILIYVLILVYFVRIKGIIKFDIFTTNIIICYVVPFIISATFTPITLLMLNDVLYEEYLISGLISRSINVLILFTIFLGCYDICKAYTIPYQKICNIYIYGVFFILGLFGIWQILNIFFNIPIIEFNTRSHIHSISNQELINLSIPLFRITSIADEPSYLAPFLIDAIILSLMSNKKLIPICLILLSIYTISFGCYINIGILLMYSFIKSKKVNYKHCILFIVLLVFIGLLFKDYLIPVFNIFLNRKELSFDSNILLESSRFYVIWIAIKSVFSGSIINLLLGYGPGSFEYLSDINGMINSWTKFFETSNNLYIDILYEGGIISLILIIVLCIYLFKIAIKIRDKRVSLYIQLLVLHLMVSSMYRADFVSIRFFALLLIIASIHNTHSIIHLKK